MRVRERALALVRIAGIVDQNVDSTARPGAFGFSNEHLNLDRFAHSVRDCAGPLEMSNLGEDSLSISPSNASRTQANDGLSRGRCVYTIRLTFRMLPAQAAGRVTIKLGGVSLW